MLRNPGTHAFLERPPRHARIIGPPGSGKTTLLVERWRALTARGHRPGIVAFGREHHDRLMGRLIPPGGAYLGPHPVTTHARIASAVLDAARPGRPRTLREVDELLVLGRLLRREPELLASDLAAIANYATFLKDLLGALHALAQHGISAATARSCARDCANPRARDVLIVYARHREVCDERGLVSFYDAAWRAAEHAGAAGVASPLAGFDVVLIDDFHDLDPGQYRLLTRLLPPDGATALEVFGDPTGARFSFRGTTDRFQERLGRDYATTDIELSAPQSNDVALNETIASLIEHTVHGARAPSVEPAGDLPLFAHANVSPNSTHAARPAWECTATLLIAADEIAEAQAIAARSRSAIDAGVAPGEIAIIARDAERYRAVLSMACYEWGVPLEDGGQEVGAVGDFLRSLVGALGADSDGHFAETLHAPPGGAPGDVSTLLRTLKRDYAQRGGAFDLPRMIDEHVVPLFPQSDTNSRGTLAAVVDDWHRYNEVVEHAGGGASLDEFRTHYLGQRTAHARGASRVQLLSAREATGRTFHTTFVCGAAEGFFPGVASRDGYIPLIALARAIEPVHPDAAHDIAGRLDEASVERSENALFLTALTRAAESLTITAPARIAGEATLLPRALAAGGREFAGETVTRTTSPAARAASAVAGAPPSEHLAERLRPLDELAGWWVSPPPTQRLPRLNEFSMSPSKLNSFARCARQFFYEKVLNIARPDSIYLRVGSMVHEALREIIPPGATRDEVRAALKNAGTREIAERLVSRDMKEAGAWMRELSVNYLEDMLVHVAALEAEREGDYRVRVQEEKVETEVEGMPLRGRFDRIDDVDGVGPVIIDYKTSGNIAKTYPTLIEKMESEYWQIPVYATMAAAECGDPAAFVYYVLPPGEDSLAVGVQVARGTRPAPIPLGKRRPHRYGPVDTATIAGAMARAVEIHRSIIEGECRYERTANTGTCSNCHFAIICQRSRASL
jgi:superfamily I DNA/RNA helicase/RecB family exonuclease